MDQLFFCGQAQLEIVDKTEERRGEGGVEIAGLFPVDLPPQLADTLTQPPPGQFWLGTAGERRNVAGGTHFAAHAVRPVWAGAELAVPWRDRRQGGAGGEGQGQKQGWQGVVH
jgi:hypothetical protein